jgi:hypothetical protein
MTKEIILASIIATSSACTVGAGMSSGFGPTTPTRAVSANHQNEAPASSRAYPTSGGATLDTAEPISLGTTIEGVVNESSPRYYRFEAEAGRTETFTVYTELTKKEMGGANVKVQLLALDGEKLAGTMTATYAPHNTPEMNKDVFVHTFAKAEPVILLVTGDDNSAHYKIVLSPREAIATN